MSLAYSDTSNKDGIIQFIEQTLGFPDGYISGDATRLKQWTGSINLALDKTLAVLFKADGKWQFDDSNHTDYPIIFTDLVSGQRTYSFTTDEDGHVILDIHKVFFKDSATSRYQELPLVDAQSDSESVVGDITSGLTVSAFPTRADRTGTGIFLDSNPPSTVADGLKLYINREGSYFTTSDTTKTPGFYGLYHEILILEACYRYARAHRLDVQETLKRDLKEMNDELVKAQRRRAKNERDIMTGRKTNFI